MIKCNVKNQLHWNFGPPLNFGLLKFRPSCNFVGSEMYETKTIHPNEEKWSPLYSLQVGVEWVPLRGIADLINLEANLVIQISIYFSRWKYRPWLPYFSTVLADGGEEIPRLLRVSMIRDEFPIAMILNKLLSERFFIGLECR